MAERTQCVECGRFLGVADYFLGHCEVEPLNEFGPERIEWTCAGCHNRLKNEKEAVRGA
jgi:hypothetical protein